MFELSMSHLEQVKRMDEFFSIGQESSLKFKFKTGLTVISLFISFGIN